jgi:hypothetical protein
MTTKVQEALQAAGGIAARRNHQGIDVEHLLAALLEQQSGLVPNLLEAAGVATRAVQEAVERELSKRPQVQGPGAGFAGTAANWVKDEVNFYLDNFEAYEVPGWDVDMALGNTELFGQSRTYSHVVPATRGNVVGDFEGNNGGVTAPFAGTPSGHQLLQQLGWNGNIRARSNGGDSFGDLTNAYNTIVAVTTTNHFTSSAQVGSLGTSVQMHPGTVDANTQSGTRMASTIAVDGQQATDMIATLAESYSATSPQTITVVNWVRPSASFASDFRSWPGIFLSLQSTNSAITILDHVMFNAIDHVCQGEPGSWKRMVTEMDLPWGVVAHETVGLFPFPEWGLTTPPGTWGKRFMTLEFECFADRAFDAALAGLIGLTGNYAAGSTAGRATATAGVGTNVVYFDDISVHSSAMESLRYYDRNYFEDTSVQAVLP